MFRIDRGAATALAAVIALSTFGCANSDKCDTVLSAASGKDCPQGGNEGRAGSGGKDGDGPDNDVAGRSDADPSDGGGGKDATGGTTTDGDVDPDAACKALGEEPDEVDLEDADGQPELVYEWGSADAETELAAGDWFVDNQLG